MGSAQCRSSNTNTTGPLPAKLRTNACIAANICARICGGSRYLTFSRSSGVRVAPSNVARNGAILSTVSGATCSTNALILPYASSFLSPGFRSNIWVSKAIKGA